MPVSFRIFVCLVLGFSFHPAHSQDPALFENGAAYINPVNGPGYFQPLSNVLNNTFNVSLFPAADYKNEFYFYLGGNVGYHYIPENSWYFTGTTDANFESPVRMEVSTVFGPDESHAVQNDAGEYYVFPGGFKMNSVLLGVPQITVGGVANTAITFRFLAIPLDDEWGDLSLLGVGLQHVISPYLPIEKMDLTVEAGFHQFQMGIGFSPETFFARAGAAKAFEKSRIYGYLGYQAGELELTNSSANEVVTSKSNNPLLFGIGSSLDLAFFNINLELAINSIITINAGIGLKF